MSKHVKHVPKHKAAPARSTRLPLSVPRGALRTSLVVSSVAVAATGATIGGGVLATPASTSSADGASAVSEQDGSLTARLSGTVVPPSAEDAAAAAASAVDLQARDQAVSRSADRRAEADPAKEAALDVEEVAAVSGEQNLSDSDPRDIARALLGEYGFSSDQFDCLDSLWTRESNWSVTADNPTSSAYGIPQSLPGEKMASEGADWATNPVTQIRWGLGYIQDRYGSPCGAWGHSESVGWY